MSLKFDHTHHIFDDLRDPHLLTQLSHPNLVKNCQVVLLEHREKPQHHRVKEVQLSHTFAYQTDYTLQVVYQELNLPDLVPKQHHQ